MYSPGIAGGSYYTHTGGGANYQCLPRNPQWGEHTDGLASGTYMYGGEYEFPPANSPFLKVTQHFVCLTVGLLNYVGIHQNHMNESRDAIEMKKQ